MDHTEVQEYLCVCMHAHTCAWLGWYCPTLANGQKVGWLANSNVLNTKDDITTSILIIIISLLLKKEYNQVIPWRLTKVVLRNVIKLLIPSHAKAYSLMKLYGLKPKGKGAAALHFSTETDLPKVMLTCMWSDPLTDSLGPHPTQLSSVRHNRPSPPSFQT